MRLQSTAWTAILTAVFVCLPAAGLLLVTGFRCHEAFAEGATGALPEWLWSLGKAIGARGLLASFIFAAVTVAAIPAAVLIHHWRHPEPPTVSDYDIRRALGRVSEDEAEQS